MFATRPSSRPTLDRRPRSRARLLAPALLLFALLAAARLPDRAALGAPMLRPPGQTVPIPQFGDLALRLGVTSPPAEMMTAGAAVTLRVAIFNQGTLAAPDVVVSAYLPPELLFLPADNPGWAVVDGLPQAALPGALPGWTLSGAPPSSTLDLHLRIADTGPGGAIAGQSLAAYAEISRAGVDDRDSTPDAVNQEPELGLVQDDALDATGDEDDHDVAILTIVASPQETPGATPTTATAAPTETPGSTATAAPTTGTPVVTQEPTGSPGATPTETPAGTTTPTKTPTSTPAPTPLPTPEPPASGMAIRGHIRNPTGAGLAGITVHAMAVETGERQIVAHGRSLPGGAYQVELDAPGLYQLYFVDESGAYAPRYFDSAQPQSAQSIPVRAGAVVESISVTLLPPASSAVEVTGVAGAWVDPVSGRVTLLSNRADAGLVQLRFDALCPAGSPTLVRVELGSVTYVARADGGRFWAEVYPPPELPVAVVARYQCSDAAVKLLLGEWILYDPSGVVTDAQSGAPVVGARVGLYQLVEAAPDTAQSTGDCRTTETRAPTAGGPFGAWSGEPAADPQAGVWSIPGWTDDGGQPLMAPALNPQITGTDGRYGWTVAAGCWYVVVAAPGYATRTSPLVGVPPAVTDLDIRLEPLARSRPIYLPALMGR